MIKVTKNLLNCVLLTYMTSETINEMLNSSLDLSSKDVDNIYLLYTNYLRFYFKSH